MKILITFENRSIYMHCIDLLSMLRANGHQLYFHVVKYDWYEIKFYKDLISKYATILYDLTKVSEMDIWMYDLTPSSISPNLTPSLHENKSELLELLEKFKGRLICINYEDGYDFILSRASNYLIDRTDAFINNALHKDLELYDKSIRNKLVLTTSYISNSQSFKNIKVPFNSKEVRVMFTGSITGFSKKYIAENKCRVLVPMAIINANFPMIYKIYNYDSALKEIYDNDVLPIYKDNIMPFKMYLKLFSNSKYVLSLRGNGCTVNRFFEGQAANNLVFSTKFDHLVQFIGQGEENKHYVEIDWSGSDVVEKIKYYSENNTAAENIANNGRKLWEESSMLDRNGLLPMKIREEIIGNIYKVSGIQF